MLMSSKTGGERHIKDRVARVSEQRLCMLNAAVEHELMWSYARCLAKQAAEMRGAQANIFGQLMEGDLLLNMCADEFGHAPHSIWSQSAFVNPRRGPRAFVIPDHDGRQCLFNAVDE